MAEYQVSEEIVAKPQQLAIEEQRPVKELVEEAIQTYLRRRLGAAYRPG